MSRAVQPDKTIWRLGADFVTVLHPYADLDVRGTGGAQRRIRALRDLDKGNWKLIVTSK